MPERTILTLEFPNGLAELSESENCPNGLRYSVGTTKSDGTVSTQRYCRSGTASRLELFGATAVNVDVPKEEEAEGTQFTAKAAPIGTSLEKDLSAKLRMLMHSRLNMYWRILLYLVKKDWIA